FQAEDGIRDKLVTGVQTCALPICQQVSASGSGLTALFEEQRGGKEQRESDHENGCRLRPVLPSLSRRREIARRDDRVHHWPPVRSEERRVGKEGGST